MSEFTAKELANAQIAKQTFEREGDLGLTPKLAEILDDAWRGGRLYEQTQAIMQTDPRYSWHFQTYAGRTDMYLDLQMETPGIRYSYYDRYWSDGKETVYTTNQYMEHNTFNQGIGDRKPGQR